MFFLQKIVVLSVTLVISDQFETENTFFVCFLLKIYINYDICI